MLTETIYSAGWTGKNKITLRKAINIPRQNCFGKNISIISVDSWKIYLFISLNNKGMPYETIFFFDSVLGIYFQLCNVKIGDGFYFSGFIWGFGQ